MYIPPISAPLSAGTPWTGMSTAAADSSSQGWSSAIGIITAICGNILISFALNTQRYAHMRINRDHDEQEEKQRLKRRSKSRGNGYGTQEQRDAAESRAKANSKPSPTRYQYMDPEDSHETDPLIPSVDSLDRQKNAVDSSEGEDDEGQDGGDENSNKRKSYLRSPIWWAGIVMMTLGETGNFLAYGFAPASIVSPLGVVALVCNCLIAPWLLHESFRWRDAVGVVMAVSGCVTVVFSASTSNPKLDPDSIWHLITRWEFETYLGITIFLAIVLAVASNRFGEKSILIDLGLMGLFGGYTALSTKGVASLLSTTIWRTLTFPITYLLVAILIFTAIMQIKYVNRALQRFNSTQVIPTQFVLFTLSVIVGSAILYRDFERTSTEDAVKFIAGCALTFLGVWCITSGRDNESQGNDEETGEDEDAITLLDEEGVQPEIRERQDANGTRQSLIAGSSKLPTDTDVELPLPNESVDISPANAAAIHSESTSDLPSAAPAFDKDSLKPPPIHATTSDPSIPTVGATPSPAFNTPLKRGHSAIESPRKDAPNTPIVGAQRHAGASPSFDPHQAPRLSTRNSVSGLLPGPLTSPLSSSLSAIVADSLRRGVDHFPSTSIRRTPGTGGRERPARPGAERINPRAAPLKRHSIASAEMDLDDGENDDGATGVGTPSRPDGGRMRSLSATLGDIFGTPKRRRLGSRENITGQGQQRPQEPEGGGGEGNASTS